MKLQNYLLVFTLLISAMTYPSWFCWKKKKADNPLEQVTDIKPILSLIGDYTYDIEDALNAILKSDVEELKKVISIQKNFNAQEIDELKNSAKILAQVKYPNIISNIIDLKDPKFCIAMVPLIFIPGILFFNVLVKFLKKYSNECLFKNMICLMPAPKDDLSDDIISGLNICLGLSTSLVFLLVIPHKILKNLKSRKDNRAVMEIVKLLKDLK